MTSVYVSIGSNLDPENMVRRGVAALRDEFGAVHCSPVYHNAAVGFDGAPFLNLVCRFDSDRPVTAIDQVLHRIEDDNGRRRDGPDVSSRTLDLDLLLYGDLRLQQGKLKLPRDEITRYAFVLRPLADLAPDLKYPGSETTMSELWQRFDANAPPLKQVPLSLDDCSDHEQPTDKYSNSLIIIAHGSRRPQSNDEVRQLAEELEHHTGGRFSSVSCAFLELASPSIPEAIDAAVAAGAQELHLVPYFLSAGRHVAHDIPDAVDKKRRQYPNTVMHLHPHLGSSPAMPAFVLDSIDSAGSRPADT